jgi:hypothetical protein
MSSNLFQEVLTDAQGVENRLLGPTYPYYKNIKTPTQIGMSDKGTIKQMSKDIDGLIQYVEVLVSGNSKASATGQPLGNQFFLQTGAKCTAIDSCSDPNDASTCKTVDRFIYIDNVPSGNIPFISSGLGENFSEFKGLIPGAMGNLNVLNPFAMMRSFLSGTNPACQQITMQTITSDNVKSSESHYVTLTDITDMDPCIFSDGKNPVTGQKCKETFQNKIDSFQNKMETIIPDDPVAQLYFASVGIVGLFILYRLMEKSR